MGPPSRTNGARRRMSAIPLVALGTLLALPWTGCGDSSRQGDDGQGSPFAPVTFASGDRYFSVNGREQPLSLRNVTGTRIEEFDTLLDEAGRAGTRLVRLHLTLGHGFGATTSGAVDESWAVFWDHVLARARENGISVIPVFGVWFDWNDGTPDVGYHNWENNPCNVQLGGPVHSPAELVKQDSEAQSRWLEWLRTLVQRWRSRDNIAAWEVFSELDLISGVSAAAGSQLAAAASAIVRVEDPAGRPVLASLSSLAEWPALLAGDAIDMIEIHPYGGNLDTLTTSYVAKMRARYGKPVLIGESGLSAAPPDSGTLTTAPGAPIGIQHALWAGLVSGSISLRALWWEDGYAIYYPSLGLPFAQRYKDAERAVVQFVADLPVSFATLAPLGASMSSGLTGGALGDATAVVGWVRDVACAPPDFACTTKAAGERVTVAVPGAAGEWRVELIDTSTGGRVVASSTALVVDEGLTSAPASPTTRDGAGTTFQLTIELPSFVGDIAFRALPRG